MAKTNPTNKNGTVILATLRSVELNEYAGVSVSKYTATAGVGCAILVVPYFGTIGWGF